jgi:hypothetical protein
LPLAVVTLVLQILLLPPVGIETRSQSQYSPAAFYLEAVLGLLILILNVLAIPLLLSEKRQGWGVRAVSIYAAAGIFLAVFDLSGLAPSPPFAFAVIEVTLLVVSIVILWVAYSLRRSN